jgi:quercetin dioxygenase-like cupin family protein
VLSGELWLELDDGQEVHLQPGDTVIQNGTRHAWHNRSDQTTTILTAIVGARRA